VAIFPILLLVGRRLITKLELNVQVDRRRAVLRPRREPGRGRELPGAADRVRAGHRADGLARDPARPVAAFDAAAAGLRVGHHRLDARHRRFTLLSAAGTPPIVWFTATSVLVLLLLAGGGGRRLLRIPAALALAVMLLLTVSESNANEIWSPYYRINTYRAANGELYVNVNGIPHQALHPVDAPKEQFYDQLYRWFPDRKYDNVLIVGAGSGHGRGDLPAHGAGHVDASRSTGRSRSWASTSTRTTPTRIRASPATRTTGGRSCAARTRSTTW
jgi:hypothetical protein